MALSEAFLSELSEASSEPSYYEHEGKHVGDVKDNPEGDTTGDNDGVQVADDESDPKEPDSKQEGDASGKEKESEVKPEAKPKGISDHALLQAIQSGFTIQEAREYVNDNLLLTAVEKVRSSLPTTEAAEKPEVPSDAELFAKLPTIDAEKFEPEVVQTFDALKEIIQSQHDKICGFEAYMKQSMQDQQDAGRREVTSWFDGQCGSLGDDFKEVLGVGNIDQLNPSSEQYATRDALATRVGVLMRGYQSAGGKMPSRDEIFQEAAQSVLRGHFEKLREKKLADELEQRSKQHINRVAGKQHKTESDPIEETARMLDEKFFKS